MTTITQPRVSETLRKAADLIEERGWAISFGWYGQQENIRPGSKDTQPLCIEGGIMAALGIEYGYKLNADGEVDEEAWGIRELHECPAFQAVAGYIRNRFGLTRPFVWNDSYATQSHVTDVLRTVATQEEEKENNHE